MHWEIWIRICLCWFLILVFAWSGNEPSFKETYSSANYEPTTREQFKTAFQNRSWRHQNYSHFCFKLRFGIFPHDTKEGENVFSPRREPSSWPTSGQTCHSTSRNRYLARLWLASDIAPWDSDSGCITLAIDRFHFALRLLPAWSSRFFKIALATS